MTYVRTNESKAPKPAIFVPFAFRIFRARHNRIKMKKKLWSPPKSFVTSCPVVWCRFASSSATRNENSSKKGVAANWAILPANELVSVTLLILIAVKKPVSFKGRTGRLGFSSGGLCIVQIGSVTKRQSRVATRTKGQNTITKAGIILKSVETEWLLVTGCFSGSSALKVMLLETAIALSEECPCWSRRTLVDEIGYDLAQTHSIVQPRCSVGFS
jgi:hypothetical protein